MAFNKEKVTAVAMKHLQKGALEKAVREFEKILEMEPSDERTLQKVADLYARMNRKQAALNAYRRVSDLYVKHGFYLKAIAVYKQILKLDPEQMELYKKLAEMYQQLGLLSETIQQYKILIKYYEENNKEAEALDALKKIVEIEPDDLPNRIRLAEGLIRSGKAEEGLAEYDQAASELKRQKREDDYIRVLDRIVFHAPERIEQGRELCRLLIERGESQKGLVRLQKVLKQQPESIETLELLALSFQKMRQLVKTITVYREMARILRSRGDHARLGDIYDAILKIDPENQEALEGKKAIPYSLGRPGEDATLGEDVEDDLEELGTLSEVPGGSKTPKKPKRRTAPKTPDKPSTVKLMTEAEVFTKYGLHDQAESRLRQILELEPANLEALQKLKVVLVALEELEDVEQTLVEIAALNLDAGKLLEAREALDEAVKLDINAQKISGILDEIDQGEAAGAVAKLRELFHLQPVEAAAELTLPEVAPMAPISNSSTQPLQLEPDVDEFGVEEIEAVAEDEPLVELDIDFDQEVELIDDDDLPVEEIEAEPMVEEEAEPEIIEEVELPPHLRPEAQAESVAAPPARETPKPPALPQRDGIEISEEFDDDVLDELLISEEIESVEPPPMPADLIGQTEDTTGVPEAEIEESFEEVLVFDDIENEETLEAELVETVEEETIEPPPLDLMDAEEITSTEEDLEAGADDVPSVPQEPVSQEIAFEEVEAESVSEPNDDQIVETAEEEAEFALEEDLREDRLQEGEAQPEDLDTIGLDDVLEEVESETVSEAPPLPEEAELDLMDLADIEIEEETLSVLEEAPDLESVPLEELTEDVAQDSEAEDVGFLLEDDSSDTSFEVAETEVEPEPEAQEDRELELPPMELPDQQSVDHLPLAELLDEDQLEDFEEAEFFFEQAVYAECLATYEELLEQYPAHPELLEKVETCRRELDEAQQRREHLHLDKKWSAAVDEQAEEMGAGETQMEAVVDWSTSEKEERLAGGAQENGSVDLGAEIMSGLDLDDDDDEDGEPFVGEGKRVHVADQIAEDETETHLNLGIAYREMGLLDEAIGEFLVAEKRGLSLRATMLLAFCYLEKGRLRRSMEFFQKATQHEKLTRSAFLGMRYDLGIHFEKTGQVEQALNQYKAIEQLQSDYRNVAELIENLEQAGETPAEPGDLEKILDETDVDALPEGDPEPGQSPSRNKANITYV